MTLDVFSGIGLDEALLAALIAEHAHENPALGRRGVGVGRIGLVQAAIPISATPPSLFPNWTVSGKLAGPVSEPRMPRT